MNAGIPLKKRSLSEASVMVASILAMSASSSGLMGRRSTSVPSVSFHGATKCDGYGAMMRCGVSGLPSSTDLSRMMRASTAHGLPTADHHGIDVDLGDFGEVDDDVGQLHQHLIEDREVRRFHAARRALHRLEDARLLHHPSCKHLIERGQANREVGQTLRADAARAKHQHRTELTVLLHAENQLVVDRPNHALDRDALDHGVGCALLHALEHLGVGALQVLRRAHADLHAADGVLVRDLVRHDLEHDGIADRLGGLERLVERAPICWPMTGMP